MIFWFLYLLLFPFHIFEEGSVQIADVLILIGIAFNLKSMFKVYFNNNLLKVFFYYTFYSLIVGIFYWILYQEPSFLKNPLNYMYCFTFILFISVQAQNKNFNIITIISVFVSLLIQLITFLKFASNEELRILIYFNNPNQLGFWAINMLFILLLYFLTLELSRLYKIIILISIFLSLIFVIMSISQAAIVASFFMISVFIISKGYYKILFTTVIFIFILFGAKTIDTFKNITIYENAINRIEARLDGKDDNGGIEGRNYNRIIDFPKFLIFGSGEGKNERFGTQDLNEIHSTFPNILFSYGVIGLILFLYPFYFIIKKNIFSITLILLFYLSFTFLHNMIRWPLFWVIPILVYYNKYNKININVRN